MPETQFKRLHDPFIKIIKNLFAVSIKVGALDISRGDMFIIG